MNQPDMIPILMKPHLAPHRTKPLRITGRVFCLLKGIAEGTYNSKHAEERECVVYLKVIAEGIQYQAR